MAEAAVLDVAGHPVDRLVGLEHPVADVGDLHVPGGHRLVDDRRVGAPAVRVVVGVAVVADQLTRFAQVLDDAAVGLEHVLAGPLDDVVGEATRVVDRHDHADAGFADHPLVVLAETGGHVHDAGALGGVDEVAGEDLECPFGAVVRLGRVDLGHVGEVREDRCVGAADEVGTLEGADLGGVLELLFVAADDGFAEQVARAVVVEHHGVVEFGADGECEVRGQGPRRGGPGEDLGGRVGIAGDVRWVVELERDGDGRVLTGARGIVETNLVVRQRGLRPPAVRQHAVGLIDQPLVPQLLERPHDRLHVVEVHGLVVVLEIDPAGLTGDRLLPLLGVLEHRGAAVLVETLDAVVDDRRPATDGKVLLGFHLGGEAMAVPAEAALDPLALHGLVPGHHVLHVAGEQVTVVREAVGERRTVVEDVFVVLGPALHALVEGLVGAPPRENSPLDAREVRALDMRVRRLRCVTHSDAGYRRSPIRRSLFHRRQ